MEIPFIIKFIFIASGYIYASEVQMEAVKPISIQLTDVSLSEAMSQIEKVSGCSFFYDANNVDLSLKVSLNVSNESLRKVLDTILDGTGLSYEISQNQVLLLPRTTNSVSNTLTQGTGTQQKRNVIKGKILDSMGQPVIGANIVEKGTTNGTISDMDGLFTLDVSDQSVLEVSYIGFVSQQVKAPSDGGNVTITLKEDSETLDEVVVTGFGLAQKKATLTGAISSVGAKDLVKATAANASTALAGKIAGVNFRQTDGRPGATTKVQIRNMGTPLYVIDGVVKDEGQFNNIDFHDIESISILKDASASIYGVRAANGVVVVTTKKGSRNTKNTVGINMYYGWQNPSKFAKPADASTYLSHYIASETVQNVASRTYSQEDYTKWLQGTEKGYVPFDWYDYIWNTSPQYYASANVSGGSDKINYYLSLGHMNQDAMIVNYGGFHRTNVQMNIESQINDKLKIGASMNGRIETTVNPGVPEADDYWMPVFGTYRNLPTKRPFANDNPDYPTQTSTNPATNFGWLNYEKSGKYQTILR